MKTSDNFDELSDAARIDRAFLAAVAIAGACAVIALIAMGVWS